MHAPACVFYYVLQGMHMHTRAHASMHARHLYRSPSALLLVLCFPIIMHLNRRFAAHVRTCHQRGEVVKLSDSKVAGHVTPLQEGLVNTATEEAQV